MLSHSMYVSTQIPKSGLLVSFGECGHVVFLEERSGGRPNERCPDCHVCVDCGVSLVNNRPSNARLCYPCASHRAKLGTHFTGKPVTSDAKRESARHHQTLRRRAKARYTDLTPNHILKLKLRARVCAMCGDPLGLERHLEHIVPLNAGGTHTRDNVRVTCSPCNLRRPKDGSDAVGHQLNIWMVAP